jgi:hypothetical protein
MALAKHFKEIWEWSNSSPLISGRHTHSIVSFHQWETTFRLRNVKLRHRYDEMTQYGSFSVKKVFFFFLNFAKDFANVTSSSVLNILHCRNRKIICNVVPQNKIFECSRQKVTSISTQFSQQLVPSTTKWDFLLSSCSGLQNIFIMHSPHLNRRTAHILVKLSSA